MNLQRSFDLEVAELEHGEEITRRVKPLDDLDAA